MLGITSYFVIFTRCSKPVIKDLLGSRVRSCDQYAIPPPYNNVRNGKGYSNYNGFGNTIIHKICPYDQGGGLYGVALKGIEEMGINYKVSISMSHIAILVVQKGQNRV